MSVTKIFNTSSPATFDADKIEIVGDKFQLKLQDNTGQIFNQDFANDIGFIYDSSKAEFTGGKVQQKDNKPSNATFGASYTNSIDGSWGDGVLTGTGVGSPAITGNKLDLTGGITRNVTYDANLNADSQQTGTIRFKWTPNYTGAPAGVNRLYTVQNTASNTNNRIWIYHTSTLLFWQINNSIGGTIVSQAEVLSPIAGVEYEICLCWDISAGETRVFLDGTQLGSTNTNTGTRDSNINYMRVGQDNSDFYIDDLLYYSTVQYTTDYIPGYTVYNYKYLESKVELPQFTYTGIGNIRAFTDIVSTESGTPKYVINNLYYSGGWISSNGTYSQANSIAEILAQIAALPESDTIDIDIIFPDNNSISDVDDLTLTYTGQIYPTDNPTILFTDILGIESLDGIIEVSTKTGSDEIKNILTQDTIKKWYNGGWINSNGLYNESNTTEEIETNKATFTISIISVTMETFLHSGDGSTTPELESISIEYDFAQIITPPSLTLVHGVSLNPDGTPNINTFTARLNVDANESLGNNQFRKTDIYISPRSNGYWEQELSNNEDMETGSYYQFKWHDRLENKIVAKQDTQEYNDLEDYE